MELAVVVETVTPRFDLQAGDTARIRYIYTPYYDLKVHVSALRQEKILSAINILLYSFKLYAANVWDDRSSRKSGGF